MEPRLIFAVFKQLGSMMGAIHALLCHLCWRNCQKALKKTDESEEKKRLGSRINEEVPERKTGESTEKECYIANINEEVAQNVETEKSEAGKGE